MDLERLLCCVLIFFLKGAYTETWPQFGRGGRVLGIDLRLVVV